MDDDGIRLHYFWLLKRGGAPHICIIQDPNHSALQRTNSGSGQNQERKTPTTELNIFLRI